MESTQTSRNNVSEKKLQRLLKMLKSGQDIRRPKIRRLRQALRSSQYENDLKLEVATERLLRDI